MSKASEYQWISPPAMQSIPRDTRKDHQQLSPAERGLGTYGGCRLDVPETADEILEEDAAASVQYPKRVFEMPG